MCAFAVYTAQAPGCSAGELSKAGPGLHALPRSKPLRFRFSGTPQKHRLSWTCVLCPSQVWAAQAKRCLASALSPREAVCLSPPLSQLLCFLGAQRERCVSPLGSWSLAATFLVDVNCPGSQEDLVSNWEPARSLVENAISGTEIAPCWLWLPPACLSASSGRWAGLQPASSPLVFTQSFVLWAAWQKSSRLELFVAKFSLSLAFFFFFSLAIPQFGLLSHVSSLRLPSGHSGLVLNQCSLCLPVQPPLAGGRCERLGYFSAGSCS